MKKIRVLIIDDSSTIQKLLENILSSDTNMEVVGIGNNGQEAVELTRKLHPDVITMDMKMPIMNGTAATRIIMQENPTPIILITSSFSHRETQYTFEALAAGAIHVMGKPNAMNSKKDFENQCKHLVEVVRLMSDVKVIRRNFRHEDKSFRSLKKLPLLESDYEIIAIGSSVGATSMANHFATVTRRFSFTHCCRSTHEPRIYRWFCQMASKFLSFNRSMRNGW